MRNWKLAFRRRFAIVGFGLALGVALVGASEAQASSIFFIRSGEIWVANPNGSGARQVTSDGGSGQPYVWVSAAKGSKPILAYLRDNTTGGSPRQLFGTMNPDGTGSTVNPDNSPNMQPLAASEGLTTSIDAAGDRVAWPKSYLSPISFAYTYFAAYSVGVDGTNEAHLLTAAATHVTFGDPSGQTLLFGDLSGGYNTLPAGCVSNAAHFVLVRQAPAPTGGQPGTPTFYCASGGADLTQPALRADGQMIAAVQGGSPGSIVTIPIGGTATGGAGSPVMQVTPAGVTGDYPDFSPDGTQIAFQGAGSTIDTVSASGGTPTQVLTNATSPAFSPYTLPGGGGGSTSTGNLTVHVRLVFQRKAIKVVVTVGGPSVSLNIKLYRNGHFVRTSFNGNVKPGKISLHIHPTKRGKYVLKVTAKVGNATKALKRHFKIK